MTILLQLHMCDLVIVVCHVKNLME